MDNELKNSIENVERFPNDPDEVSFLGYFFNYTGIVYNDKHQRLNVPCRELPFVAWTIYDKKVIYGSERETHYTIEEKALEDLLSKHTLAEIDNDYPNYHVIDKLKEINEHNGIETTEEDLNGGLNAEMYFMNNADLMHNFFYNRLFTNVGAINGRVFVPEIDGKRYTIITFWFPDDRLMNQEMIYDIVIRILNDHPELKDSYGIYIANGSKQYIIYSQSQKTIDPVEFESNRDQEIAHLANQAKKRKMFAPFRKERDMRNQKIYNHTDSGTEAEYRSLKYVDESVEESKMQGFGVNEEMNNLANRIISDFQANDYSPNFRKMYKLGKVKVVADGYDSFIKNYPVYAKSFGFCKHSKDGTSSIFLKLTKNITVSTLLPVIAHEYEHALDNSNEKYRKIRQKYNDFTAGAVGVDLSNGDNLNNYKRGKFINTIIPSINNEQNEVKYILYALWNPTERNAHVAQNIAGNNKQIQTIEKYLDYISKFDASKNTKFWQALSFIIKNRKNSSEELKQQVFDPNVVKNYFIKKSRWLLERYKNTVQRKSDYATMNNLNLSEGKKIRLTEEQIRYILNHTL